jgi:hypothetical protein
VELAHGGEIGVGEDVAVQHEHGAARQVGGVANAAAGAERLGLDHVPQAYAEVLGLAESPADVVNTVRAREDDVGHSVLPEERELICEEGPPEQRDHRLGSLQGERP